MGSLSRGWLTFHRCSYIKEKNVLSNQYHNYMKCHTELVAMATYIVDIDKNKSEDLKVRLAENTLRDI